MNKRSAWDMENALHILKEKGITPRTIEPVYAKRLNDLYKVEDFFNVVWRVPCWKVDLGESDFRYLRMDNGEFLKFTPNRVTLLSPNYGIVEEISKTLTVIFIKRKSTGEYWVDNVLLRDMENPFFEQIIAPGA